MAVPALLNTCSGLIEHLLKRRPIVNWRWLWGDSPPKTLLNPCVIPAAIRN